MRLITFFLCILSLPTAPAMAMIWPGSEWEIRISARDTGELERFLFNRTGNDRDKKGLRTDAALIVKDGRIIYEKYARGYGSDNPHLLWSISKAVTNGLAAIAVREGRMSVNDSICRFISVNEPAKCRITVDHLLRWSSGLDWAESYENGAPMDSSVLAMLYGQGREDMGKFVLDHRLRAEPGTLLSYSTGDSTLLSEVIKVAMGTEYPRIPWHGIFDPIGMTSAVWERDQSGTFIGGSYTYLTPRDLARFGLLYLNDGIWKDTRILPAGWVAYSTRLSDAAKNPASRLNGAESPGAQWWLNVPIPERGLPAPFPDAPRDTFVAVGHWGQYLIVIPSLNTVVVRVGDDRHQELDLNRLITLVRKVIQ